LCEAFFVRSLLLSSLCEIFFGHCLTRSLFAALSESMPGLLRTAYKFMRLRGSRSLFDRAYLSQFELS
jgi:hypothetical protein